MCAALDAARESASVATKLFDAEASNLPHLPVSGTTPADLHTIGVLLAKTMFDGRAADYRLAGSLFKFLRNVKPTLQDLGQYDKELMMTLSRMLVMPGMADGLDFAEVTDRSRPVTDSNKAEYVHAKVSTRMCSCVEPCASSSRECYCCSR